MWRGHTILRTRQHLMAKAIPEGHSDQYWLEENVELRTCISWLQVQRDPLHIVNELPKLGHRLCYLKTETDTQHKI